jgi:hypothetical protein
LKTDRERRINGRWIRARVTVKDERGSEKTFCDVGLDELQKLKSKYRYVAIENENDWGRYSNPRNEKDKEEKAEMMKVLGTRKRV